MKLTASDLQKLGIVEHVFPEPDHYTPDTMDEMVDMLTKSIVRFLSAYGSMEKEELLEHRYRRFREM